MFGSYYHHFQLEYMSDGCVKKQMANTVWLFAVMHLVVTEGLLLRLRLGKGLNISIHILSSSAFES